MEILEVYRERVNSYLENYLSSISPNNSYQSGLNHIMKYSVLAGGKRFRPILTYTIANLFGIDIQKVDSSACAIELIHIYSLIHDDLHAMDDDDMRHNQPSSHKVYGCLLYQSDAADDRLCVDLGGHHIIKKTNSKK